MALLHKPTIKGLSDSQVLGDLLKQIHEDERIDSLYTDGAYDTKYCREVIVDLQAHTIKKKKKMLSDGKTKERAQLREMKY